MKHYLLSSLALAVFGMHATVHPAAVDLPALEVVWSSPTDGPVYGTPVVADGWVFFGSDDGELRAVNARDGGMRWRHATGGGIRSTPAVAAGRVFVTSDDGRLYAVAQESGAVLWSVVLDPAPKPRVLPGATDATWDYRQASPVVARDSVFVGSTDGTLRALAVNDGTELWRYSTSAQIRAAPLVANGAVFVGSWDGSVHALDAVTGKPRWTFATGGIVHSIPARFADGTLVVGSRNPFLFGLDASTGGESWRFSYGVSWVESSAVIANNTAFIGSSDALKAYAFSAEGEKRWETSFDAYAWDRPALADGVIYLGLCRMNLPEHHDRRHGLIALDAADGSLVAYTPVAGSKDPLLDGIAGGAVVQDSLVYAGALDGTLYAFRAPSR